MRSTLFGLLILLATLSHATPPESFVPTEDPDYFYGENLHKRGEFVFLHFEKGKLIYTLIGSHGNLQEKAIQVYSIIPGPGDAWYIKYRINRTEGGHIIAVGGIAALLALKEEIGFAEAYKAALKNKTIEPKVASAEVKKKCAPALSSIAKEVKSLRKAHYERILENRL